MVSIFLPKIKKEEINLKLKEGIKILKNKYPEHIILVKNGLFYNAIGKDAILLSNKVEFTKICFANV